MKFLSVEGQVDNSSYYRFKFSKHNKSEVCIGDLVWSDGEYVEVSDFVCKEVLNDLYSLIENNKAFKGALRRLDII